MEKRSPASGSRFQISNFKSQIPSSNLKFQIILWAALLSLAFAFSLPGEKKEPQEKNCRKAAVAGAFYPGSKTELEQYVDALLRQADPPKITGSVRAIIVPHAGYVYSGPVAAYAYKTIAGQDIRTVILMCNSHRSYLNGIAVYKSGSFQTPLGLVPIDEEKVAKLLAASPKIMDRPDIHEEDHVLEVQLPFLQRTLKDFKIIPLLFGSDSAELSGILADALKNITDDQTLIVASTDMSHYPPYENANIADRETINAILTGKAGNLDKTLSLLEGNGVPQAETFLCGVSGVKTAMMVAEAEGATEIKLLKYANSGDTAGDKRRVVGYSAIAFVGKQNAVLPPKEQGTVLRKRTVPDSVVSPQEEIELLNLARSTVESYVRDRKIPSYTPTLPGIQKNLGAFVTLKEGGQLRGCIGRFEPSEPLYKIVQQMAVAAATEDPRFRPVSVGELDKLEYEISVLSPLKKVPNADAIELGKHGVEVRKGFFNHGVFLPQVATETGWSKEEFLGELCSQKAGLPRDCWKDPKTDLYVFTAQVFPEEKK